MTAPAGLIYNWHVTPPHKLQPQQQSIVLPFGSHPRGESSFRMIASLRCKPITLTWRGRQTTLCTVSASAKRSLKARRPTLAKRLNRSRTFCRKHPASSLSALPPLTAADIGLPTLRLNSPRRPKGLALTIPATKVSSLRPTSDLTQLPTALPSCPMELYCLTTLPQLSIRNALTR